MFLKEALLLLAGLAAGSTVAAGVYAFLVVIGVYPRLIGKTATASKGKIFLYETIIALGGLFGNVVDLFTEKVKQLTGSFLRIAWPAAMPEAELWQKAAEGGGRTGAGAGFLVMLGNVSGQLLLAAAGLSCGIFVGCLVMSLAETLKALPVLSRTCVWQWGCHISFFRLRRGNVRVRCIISYMELEDSRREEKPWKPEKINMKHMSNRLRPSTVHGKMC